MVENLDQLSKIKKISNKKNLSKTGSKNGEIKLLLIDLTSNLSIAKGILATLELQHQSVWIKKYKKTDPAHLRILLQEVMEEIWNAEQTLSTMKEMLKKKYHGICLL